MDDSRKRFQEAVAASRREEEALRKREQDQVWAMQMVAEAWTNAGPYPEYHYRMQASLKDQWPTLGCALDRLAKTL